MLYGKHNQGHSCPECGKETTGSHSEGGVRWALCPDCYVKKLEERRDQLNDEIKSFREG